MSTHLGQEINRVDGPLKVKGEAKYAAEFQSKNLLYGVVVSSTIAKGKITSIDTSKARGLEGVIEIYTHDNRPHMAWFDKSYNDQDAPGGSPFRPLYDSKIQYNAQPIALIVAQDFELARYAATLIEVKYALDEFETDLDEVTPFAPGKKKSGYKPPPPPRGDSKKAFAEAPYKIAGEYSTPYEHHNPMEMHASTVIYEEDKFTVYDKTQGVLNSQDYICKIFNLSPKDVRVLSPYVGGAFGSGLRPQYQLVLAMMAAKELKKSVRVVLTRQQMFTFGYRPHTKHKIALSANKEGKLLSMDHEALSVTSQFENYTENVVNWTASLYQCENVTLDYKLGALDLYTPIDMRAPGAVLGLHALETAMDELSYIVGEDPLKFRLKNYASKDQAEDKPFSSKELWACYEQGAQKFGWSERKPTPRSMKRGHKLVGHGMATGIWEHLQQKASAKATMTRDGKLHVASATSDIGTGTYTIMSQIAADTFGMDIKNVESQLGDSSLPMAPLEGGSWTAASVGSAVQTVCLSLQEKILGLAKTIFDSPFKSASMDDVTFTDGLLTLKKDPSTYLSIKDIMIKLDLELIETESTQMPNLLKQQKYAAKTHSAVFVEVEVDEDFGTVKVSRVVSAIAAGKILNPKTARSQIIGGVVWGLGMALQEETMLDHQLGKFMNHSLAEYHIPVNADVPNIEVIFVKEDDEMNQLGIKGLGEIGIVGVSAAIGNAIYHATGVRVRDLPMTLDKIAFHD